MVILLFLDHGTGIYPCEVSCSAHFLIKIVKHRKARVWSKTTWETVHILEGHSANVWAVLVLENDLIVTGIAQLQIPILLELYDAKFCLQGLPIRL